MIRLSENEQIIITGAGGWLGTEMLEVLLQVNGSDAVKNFVHCLGSNARKKKLSDGTELQILAMDENREFSNIAGVIHLAFLTRDKVAAFGVKDYVFENIQITSRAIKLIEQVKPKYIATVSSGAVFSSSRVDLENDVNDNPYGFTKRIEETMLRDVASNLGANLAIGRLWGAIGAHMPLNRAFAVSDFIWQAKNLGKIQINSKHQVFRRYVSAGHFMHVLALAAQELQLSEFDSGGKKLEMADLAALISSQIDRVDIDRTLDLSLKIDDYYPKSDAFELLSARLGLDAPNFEDELAATVKHHLSQLSETGR
jgi:nucleoside-diphosphate-sugar epimerase